MTQREVQTFDPTRAERQSQVLQPLGAAAHAVHPRLQTSLALLFDRLSRDQIGVRCRHGLLRAA